MIGERSKNGKGATMIKCPKKRVMSFKVTKRVLAEVEDNVDMIYFFFLRISQNSLEFFIFFSLCECLHMAKRPRRRRKKIKDAKKALTEECPWTSNLAITVLISVNWRIKASVIICFTSSGSSGRLIGGTCYIRILRWTSFL
ncbi:hypothetical protein Bca52824_027873 [Brassica carinata]|uniref:Uncharacterized protein n=1 Tax=Brassica carinata TaxID=52824 RepID=A0A8X8AM00_BRACI|nr:hypothetical protein Bca52824_027873 [Brassica carinata]